MGRKLHITPFYHNRPNFIRTHLCDSTIDYENLLNTSQKIPPGFLVSPKHTPPEDKLRTLSPTESSLSSNDVAARCLLLHGHCIHYGRGSFYHRRINYQRIAKKPTDLMFGVELELVFRDKDYGRNFNNHATFSGNVKSFIDHIETSHQLRPFATQLLEKVYTKDLPLFRADDSFSTNDPKISAQDKELLSKTANTFSRLFPYGMISNWFYFSRDGSLPSGSAELSTIPLPQSIALNPLTWDGLCEYLSPVFVSSSSPQCGLHIHVNIGYFFPENLSPCTREPPDSVAKEFSDSEDTFATYKHLVYYSVCRLYKELLHHAPTLLFYVFKRAPSKYCREIRHDRLKRFEPSGEMYAPFIHTTKAFLRWIKGLPKATDNNPSNSNIAAPRSVITVVSGALQKVVARASRSRIFAMKDMQRLLTGRTNKLAWSIRDYLVHATDAPDSDYEIEDDLTDHHSIVCLNSSTVEFRQGKGTLNPKEIRTMISFVYSFSTFVKRCLHSGHPERILSADGEELVKKFLTYAANHATEASLRNQCSLFLNPSSARVISYDSITTKETTPRHFCCDTRGE